MAPDLDKSLRQFIEAFEGYLRSSFEEIWSKVKIDADHLDAFSVVGALLARQVTLAVELANAPSAWNGHSAPLFLRAMTDLHITLAWITGDLVERSNKYLLHGLGEVKLLIEHYKASHEGRPEEESNEQIRTMIDIWQGWLDGQRRDLFVEVNLGHWAQMDVRRMAQEEQLEELYKFAYKPFSQAAHSMWPHVSVYNARRCRDPLHRYHLIPALVEAPLDVDFLYRACKYVDKTYAIFAAKFGASPEGPMPLAWWRDYFSESGDPDGTAGTDGGDDVA